MSNQPTTKQKTSKKSENTRRLKNKIIGLINEQRAFETVRQDMERHIRNTGADLIQCLSKIKGGKIVYECGTPGLRWEIRLKQKEKDEKTFSDTEIRLLY